eukprot:6584492-Pyramimonas_sp.AAC.1
MVRVRVRDVAVRAFGPWTNEIKTTCEYPRGKNCWGESGSKRGTQWVPRKMIEICRIESREIPRGYPR